MRALLRALLAGRAPADADLSALRNPDCVDAIRAAIDALSDGLSEEHIDGPASTGPATILVGFRACAASPEALGPVALRPC